MRHDAGKSAIAVAGAFLLVLAAGTLGWGLLRADSNVAIASWEPPAGGVSTTPSLTPTPTPLAPTDPPGPTASRSVKPSASKKVIPKSTETKKPAARDLPPPVVIKTSSPNCVPTTTGPSASYAQVKAALIAAANHQAWVGVQPDPALTVPLPTITVPVPLMKAVAWQESNWRSTVISCDGGVGVMQITGSTSSDVNQRFGERYDVNTLSGNASIGATYLEWLIMFFGIHFYSQNFDLATVAAVSPTGDPIALLDVVLAAYNIGYGEVIADWDKRTLSIPPSGKTYVASVKSHLTSSCECQTL